MLVNYMPYYMLVNYMLVNYMLNYMLVNNYMLDVYARETFELNDLLTMYNMDS